MTMTLKQVLEAMNTVTATSTDAENWQVVDWCSALSAHIAAMGEPVAWLRNDAAVARPDLHVITTAIRDIWTKVNAQHVERYTIPLFRAPPASGDWDAVREVIHRLRGYRREWLDGCADKLTAALPESQP